MTQTYEQRRFTLAASFSGMVWIAYAAILMAFSGLPTSEIFRQLAFTILAGTLAVVFYYLSPRYLQSGSDSEESEPGVKVISE